MIFGAMGIVQMFKTFQIPTNKTGEFILITGMSAFITGGVTLLSITLVILIAGVVAAKEEKQEAEEKLRKNLEYMLNKKEEFDPEKLGTRKWIERVLYAIDNPLGEIVHTENAQKYLPKELKRAWQFILRVYNKLIRNPKMWYNLRRGDKQTIYNVEKDLKSLFEYAASWKLSLKPYKL